MGFTTNPRILHVLANSFERLFSLVLGQVEVSLLAKLLLTMARGVDHSQPLLQATQLGRPLGLRRQVLPTLPIMRSRLGCAHASLGLRVA
jgi:hypothetical protein